MTMSDKIYTRTGDKGETSHPSMTSRVAKNHPHLAMVGTLDELNSTIGLALCHLGQIEDQTHLEPVAALLIRVQTCILTHFHIVFVSAVKSGDETTKAAANKAQDTFIDLVASMERGIDTMTTVLPPLDRFILPGGGQTGATLHIARTICRRTERRMISATESFSESNIYPAAAKFINRLSDYLFAAARLANMADGKEETKI
jgi:cob(I)alamin adenosyltransferase